MSKRPPIEPQSSKVTVPHDTMGKPRKIPGWGSKLGQRERPFPASVEVRIGDGTDNWLPAMEAVHFLSGAFLADDDAAKNFILSHIHAGVLESAAAAFLQEADIGDVNFEDIAWRDYRPKKHEGQFQRESIRYVSSEQRRVLLPDHFLAGTEGWALDRSHTLWGAGIFFAYRAAKIVGDASTSSEHMLRIRRVVTDLHFRQIDLIRLSERPGASPQSHHGDTAVYASTHSAPRHAQKNLQPWTDEGVMAELRGRIANGTMKEIDIPTRGRNARARLIDYISAAVPEISARTAGRRADRLLDEWKAADKLRERSM